MVVCWTCLLVYKIIKLNRGVPIWATWPATTPVDKMNGKWNTDSQCEVQRVSWSIAESKRTGPSGRNIEQGLVSARWWWGRLRNQGPVLGWVLSRSRRDLMMKDFDNCHLKGGPHACTGETAVVSQGVFRNFCAVEWPCQRLVWVLFMFHGDMVDWLSAGPFFTLSLIPV
jgi:hypothetical protein